jgi:predicted dehydrogenase/threonine dehydrogenase-like Zn-dependent dehydrogenase
MKQVVYDKSGTVLVKDVPIPEIDDNEILVKNEFSVLSAGTERSMIQLMKKPLLRMAIERQDLTKQVIKFAMESGVKKTLDLVKSRLDVWHLLGYSCAGVVVKAGKNVHDIGKGDYVACIGSGFANHAEYIAVPKNLAAKVPKGVKTDEAAFTGIAAIGLESVRQLKPELGENIVVIGLGLIGQMVAQMLRANGCRVIGIDIDSQKTDKPYIDVGITADTIKGVMKATGGIGADGVIIAASSRHNLVNDSFDMCRKKGRVVLLGISGMEIDRQKMFEKELEFKISTAFGAGSFDVNYDEKGLDYPIGYVRWTSNRNMQAVLELIRAKKLDVLDDSIKTYDISEAVAAYKEVMDGKSTTAVLKYSADADSEKLPAATIEINAKYKDKGKLNTAFIGAGQFVKAFLIPAMKDTGDFSFYAVAAKSGTNSKKVAEELKAKLASTNYHELLEDGNIDLVVIGTRHDTHARIAIDALSKGKNVFCEKPMAITEEEFNELRETVIKSKAVYACGFNRRYSPAMVKIKSLLDKTKPLMATYVFNNVYLPEDHWVNQPDVGGGRIIGEACHIVDLFNYLTGSEPVEICAKKVASAGNAKIKDDNNVIAVLKYKDGSVCSLMYCCMGSPRTDRESCTIIQDSSVFEMSNFSSVKLNGKSVYSGRVDEGHSNEMIELANKLRGKENDLITKEECISATEATFEIVRQVKGN